jgi:hypothetical protein
MSLRLLVRIVDRLKQVKRDLISRLYSMPPNLSRPLGNYSKSRCSIGTRGGTAKE